MSNDEVPMPETASTPFSHFSIWVSFVIRASSFFSCCFYALDVCAEFAQFFIKMFVTAVDVIYAAHFGDSIRFQSRKHQRGGRSQVACHYWRTEETTHSIDHRGRTLQLHLRAHAF